MKPLRSRAPTKEANELRLFELKNGYENPGAAGEGTRRFCNAVLQQMNIDGPREHGLGKFEVSDMIPAINAWISNERMGIGLKEKLTNAIKIAIEQERHAMVERIKPLSEGLR